MSLGTLRVLLGLDAAEFTTGLTKAEERLKRTERQAQNFGRTMSNAVAVGVAKATIALGLLDRAGGFLIRMGFDAINTAASFQDMSEKTGASAEALASFQSAAAVTNTSMETLANLSVKLTKGLAGTDEETKQAANAIKQLGFNVDEFKKLDPAAQFEAIGKRLNEFGEGAGKTAFAVAAMGRSGADALPFLKELGEQGKRNVILTAAQIKAADDFVDAQSRAISQLKQYLQIASVQALEAITPLIKVFGELAKEVLGVDSATNTLKNNKGIEEWAKSAVDKLAFVADSIGGISRLLRIAGAAIDEVAAARNPVQIIGRTAIRAHDILMEKTFRQELAEQRAKQAAAANAFESNFVPSDKPKLRVPDFGRGGGASAAASKAAQEAKKLLDKQLSDIDNFIKAEKRIFETRESDLARLYQNDQISIAAYFDERLAALDRNTTATVELYDKQIRAQEAFAAAAKRRKDEPAAIDAQKQIGRIQSEIEDVLHEKQQRALKIDDERTQAAQAYADQVDEVRARVLELLGTEQAALQAAKLRFDIQNRSVIQGVRREKDPALEADIAALRKQADAQTQINVLLKDAGVIEQNLATAQAKLHLERDLGMRDEITTLDLVGKASGEAAAQLKLIADQYLAIAVASKDPQIIANALALKQRVDELAAATDILAAKIRQTFVDTGASAIETFLNSVAEGKNVLDSFANAFKQFANDIIRQINRIAAEKIAASLFKGGSDGGIFGSIADAFVAYIGGLSGRESGGPVSGSTKYIVGERGPEIFVPRTVAAEATRQIDSLIAQRGKPAEYTDHVKAATVATNLPHLIGAKGPEIFVPKVDGIVIPNNKVAKLSAVLERRAAGPAAAIARRREISAPLRTIIRDEKIITRYTNAPYSRRASGGPVAAHVPYIVGERGREIFIPKTTNAEVQRDEAISKLSTAFQKQDKSSILISLPNWSIWQVRGASTATASRMAPQVYIQQSATEIRNRAATGLGLPSVIGAHQPTRDLARPALKLAARMGIIPTLTEPSRRAVAELVANAPRQRRAGGGPVAAHTPYVVGEFGPELFMPKSAGQIIKNEKAIDDLVSNTIQHRASSGPNVTYILGGHETFISKLASTSIKNEKFISDLVSNTAQHSASIKNERVHNDLVLNTRNEKIINQLVSNIQRGPFAAHQTYLIDEREIFVPKSARKVIVDDKAAARVRSPLLERRQHQLARVNVVSSKHEKAINDLVLNTVQRRAIGSPIATRTPYIIGELRAEVFMPKAARRIIKNDLVSNTVQRNEKTINQLVSNIQRRTELDSYGQKEHRADNSGRNFAQHLAKTLIRDGVRPLDDAPFAPKSVNKVIKSKKIVDDIVSSVQRRAIGGPVDAHQTYLVRELRPELVVPKLASKIKNEKVIYTHLAKLSDTSFNIQAASGNKARSWKRFVTDPGQWGLPNILGSRLPLVTNIIQHKAQGGPVHGARQTYIVGERGPELFVTRSAKKIIKNESRISELVTNNARRNEKIVNDLVSKTVHHRERAVATTPDVAAKIIKNESRISELVSNNVQRDKEIINRLVTATRRESARSNQLLIVGAHGPELFIPKVAGSVIKNEQRINDLVSNIEHRNIGRRSEKTIDEIISSTVQRRAKEGPVAAYRTHLGSETNITNNNGVSVPADFFSNLSYRRAIGGMVAANRPYIVGEKGPEMFVPKSAGTIVSNNRMGGVTQHITFNVATPITRDTQNQIASRTLFAAQRAVARGVA